MLIVYRFSPILFALVCLALSGCQATSWFSSTAAVAPGTASNEMTVAEKREGSSLAESDVQQAASFSDKASVDSASNITPLSNQELQQSDEVLRELELIGTDDPQAAQQLIKRLQGVKPSLRPLVAREFRTSWQFHRQKFGTAQNGVATSDSSQHIQPYGTEHVANLPANGLSPVAPESTPTSSPLEQDKSPAENSPPVDTVPRASGQKPFVLGSNGRSAYSAGAATHDAMHAATTSHLLASTVANPYVEQASYQQTPALMPMPSATTEDAQVVGLQVEEPRDWQEALSGAIDQLARQSSNDPRNTLEAYEHVRLRLMQLAAGDKDQALDVIPGLTPTEQSYWSNQMFAIATLLEHDSMPDDQQRAALASQQLAEAQSRLGELANLAANSLTFCDKVYGFGDYDKRKTNSFKAGESVTLYTEIENFRSESTEKGYHTSLATSYEVLDQSGNRVEGGEFANVDDYCARKRSDFYIEYTIELPDRIYASKYELRLLIRDRLSGKIGKSTLELEIID